MYVKMFVTMKERTDLKVGHVGSESRPLGQILEKICVLSSRHSFVPVCMKLRENVCHNQIWTNSKLGHVGSKSRSLDQILEKTFYTLKV